MNDDIPLLSIERRHTGPRGEFILRRHEALADIAATAIRRRTHPEWSQLRDEVRAA